jgi:hypothetical protein
MMKKKQLVSILRRDFNHDTREKLATEIAAALGLDIDRTQSLTIHIEPGVIEVSAVVIGIPEQLRAVDWSILKVED